MSTIPGAVPAASSPVLVRLQDLEVGQSIGEADYPLSRDTLVRYAGASGDFNPIHYNDAVASSVGLPGVIAHGMLTMGTAINLVTDWVGDPGAICEYGVRFTKPVPVPATGETSLHVTGKIGAIDPSDGTVRVDLTVTHDGEKVLLKSRALVAVESVAIG